MPVVAALAAALLGTAAVPAASAAVTPGAARVSPDTAVVSCLTTGWWLKLTNSLTLRSTCYKGNGVLAVNLTGINLEKIVGVHFICLAVSPPLAVTCATGPRTIRFTPPKHVTSIRVTTP